MEYTRMRYIPLNVLAAAYLAAAPGVALPANAQQKVSPPVAASVSPGIEKVSPPVAASASSQPGCIDDVIKIVVIVEQLDQELAEVNKKTPVIGRYQVISKYSELENTDESYVRCVESGVKGMSGVPIALTQNDERLEIPTPKNPHKVFAIRVNNPFYIKP